MIKSLGRCLGHGHFGMVHEGQDDLRGTVAVKVLKKPAAIADADWTDMQATLLQEGQRLVKASHLHVVPVYYIDPAPDGDLRLVMELCVGSLAKRHAGGPIPLGDVRNIGTSVASGLECMHARGMLHRDVKPSNILIDANGVVRLGDFGLVTDRIIYGYASVGDERYAPHVAKEVWDGFGTSERSDIFALGVTLYRLIHGEDWYVENTPKAPAAIKRGRYGQRLPWLAHVPKKWRTFIRKCLHDETSERLQSASAVLTGLAKLPTEPSWLCECAADKTTWRVTERGRHLEVVLSAGQSWTATSFPVGAGIKRTLGGSKSIRDLVEFFEERHHR